VKRNLNHEARLQQVLRPEQVLRRWLDATAAFRMTKTLEKVNAIFEIGQTDEVQIHAKIGHPYYFNVLVYNDSNSDQNIKLTIVDIVDITKIEAAHCMSLFTR
jgi:hypothetical protein